MSSKNVVTPTSIQYISSFNRDILPANGVLSPSTYSKNKIEYYLSSVDDGNLNLSSIAISLGKKLDLLFVKDVPQVKPNLI